MPNAICWFYESTIDNNFGLTPEGLIQLSKEFLDKNILPSCHQTFKDIINQGGLKGDTEPSGKISGEELKRAIDYVREREDLGGLEIVIGGSPAISAVTAYKLRDNSNQNSNDLPWIYYTGLYPTSVQEAVQLIDSKDGYNLGGLFLHAKKIDGRPATLSLELKDRKLMLSNKEKRKFEDFRKEDLTFECYIDELKKISNQCSGKLVLALGGLTKGTTGDFSDLVTKVRESFGEKALVFVGTNSFAGKTDEEIKSYWNEVISKADMISMNDQELNSVYKAIFGINSNKSLSAKLDQLYKNKLKTHGDGIMVCHAAQGAIMINTVNEPERIITNLKPDQDPSAYFEESLRLAVDGATYIYGYGANPNYNAVKSYSRQVKSRQDIGFNVSFLYNGKDYDKLPNGMIGVVAPDVGNNPNGSVTGLGAKVDALLASFLMRS